MKVICLDIDGVLNYVGQEMSNFCYNLNFEKVKLLNKLIIKTKANILLSSAWRTNFTGSPGVNMFFEAVGIIPVCIGITPKLNSTRETEILCWLVENRYSDEHFHIDSLVILDDDNDMGILMPYLIQTDSKKGLTTEKIKIAELMLKNKFDLNIPLKENDEVLLNACLEDL